MTLGCTHPDGVACRRAEPADFDPASRKRLYLTDPESLALASRRMRRHAGLSQRALAAKSGVSKTTIERIETATVDPTIATLLTLVSTCDARLAVCDLDPTTFIFGSSRSNETAHSGTRRRTD